MSQPDKLTAPQVPGWFPAWAGQLADLYFSGTTSFFVLHGNVHDPVHCPSAPDQFLSLPEFLATQVFGSWEVVTGYDLGKGLHTLTGGDAKRLQEMVQRLSARLGAANTWPRDPDQVLSVLDQLLQRNLLEANPADRLQMALVFEYAQYLVPAADLASVAGGKVGSRLVRMLRWAQNPYVKRQNIAFCLLADKLAEVNDRLVQSPHVAAIEVPLPDETTRRVFVEKSLAGKPLGKLTADGVTGLSSGLSLVNLNVLFSVAARRGQDLDAGQFARLKKTLIERQCQGLVSFVQPSVTLDLVVGHEAAVERLKQDAAFVAQGRFESAPMGYLVCGPVGTGKTFLAECFAGSVGIPCLTLKNFRSKYVGETEGNLEHVLNVLRSLGPIVVIIDEADAALGNREASGDSGTSSRVFSMIASQMGNTQYRGRIIWMLLTSRPDLLPIDLKRQGRAEVHIPLLYPETPAEVAAMFRSMAKKNKITLAADASPDVPADRQLSGADLESILVSAKRRVMAANRESVERADLEAAIADFIPSAQGLEKELQELNAVLECTSLSFLPERWRTQISQPNGRVTIQERANAIRRALER